MNPTPAQAGKSWLARLSEFSPMDRNNRIFTFLFGLSAASLGSAVSFFVSASFVWSLFKWARGVLRYRFDRREKIVGYSFLALFAIIALATALRVRSIDDLAALSPLVNYVTLAFFFPVLARVKLSDGRDLFLDLARGACLGLFLSCVIAIYQYYVLRVVAEGFAGNQGPYALFCAIAAAIVHIAVFLDRSRWRMAYTAAYFAALLCVILSGQRIATVIVVLNALIVLVIFQRPILARFSLGKTILAIALAGMVVAVGFPIIKIRIDHTLSEITRITEQSDLSTSAGLRLMMWEATSGAIADHPLLGIGAGPPMRSLDPYMPPRFQFRFNFSHVHNAYLDIALKSGALGLFALFLYLLAPIWAVFNLPRDELQPVRRAMILCLVASFAVNGLTGIIVKNGLYSALFLYLVVIAMTPLKARNIAKAG